MGGTRGVSFFSAPCRGAAAVLLGFLSATALCGCALRPPQRVGKAALMVVLERGCLVSIELTEHSECVGPDIEHLRCAGLLLTKKNGCETLRVERR